MTLSASWAAAKAGEKIAVAAAAAVGLVLVVIVAWWLFTSPGRHRAEAARAKAGGIVAGRNAGAGRDAVAVVAGNAAGEKSIDQSVRESTDEIRNAPEDQRNAAALRALCLRDAYRRDPACRQLRQPHP